ncbi:MAG: type II secretion system protein [Acidobacteriota bacterium]
MNRNHPRRQPGACHQAAGFSLIELMVAVSIIGILATLATPILSKYRDRAKIAAAKTAGREILNALAADAVTSTDGRLTIPESCDELAQISRENGFYFSATTREALCPVGNPIGSSPTTAEFPYKLCLCYDSDLGDYVYDLCDTSSLSCLGPAGEPQMSDDVVIVFPVLNVRDDMHLTVSTVTGVAVVPGAERPVVGPVEPQL